MWNALINVLAYYLADNNYLYKKGKIILEMFIFLLFSRKKIKYFNNT